MRKFCIAFFMALILAANVAQADLKEATQAITHSARQSKKLKSPMPVAIKKELDYITAQELWIAFEKSYPQYKVKNISESYHEALIFFKKR